MTFLLKTSFIISIKHAKEDVATKKLSMKIHVVTNERASVVEGNPLGYRLFIFFFTFIVLGQFVKRKGRKM